MWWLEVGLGWIAFSESRGPVGRIWRCEIAARSRARLSPTSSASADMVGLRPRTLVSALLHLCCFALVQSDDDPAEPYFLAGVQHHEAGNVQEAHDAYAKCLELTATRTDCMTNLASVLDDMDNSQAAEELYRAVLAVEPLHMDATYNLALLLQGKEGAFAGKGTAARERALSLHHLSTPSFRFGSRVARSTTHVQSERRA